jgi:hypothetical protein
VVDVDPLAAHTYSNKCGFGYHLVRGHSGQKGSAGRIGFEGILRGRFVNAKGNIFRQSRRQNPVGNIKEIPFIVTKTRRDSLHQNRRSSSLGKGKVIIVRNDLKQHVEGFHSGDPPQSQTTIFEMFCPNHTQRM